MKRLCLVAVFLLCLAHCRSAAAQALPDGMSKGRFEEICTQLKNSEKWTRFSALGAIMREACGHPSFEEPVKAMLKDPEADIRGEAAVALSQIATPANFEVLLDRIRSETDATASFKAVKGMEQVFRRLTPKDQEPIRERYLAVIFERVLALTKRSEEMRQSKNPSGFLVAQHIEEYLHDLSKDFEKKDAAYSARLVDLLMRADEKRLPILRAEPACSALIAIANLESVAGLEKALAAKIQREPMDCDAIRNAIEKIKSK